MTRGTNATMGTMLSRTLALWKLSGQARITALKDNDTFQRHGIMWVVRVVGTFGRPSVSLVLTLTCEG